MESCPFQLRQFYEMDLERIRDAHNRALQPCDDHEEVRVTSYISQMRNYSPLIRRCICNGNGEENFRRLCGECTKYVLQNVTTRDLQSTEKADSGIPNSNLANVTASDFRSYAVPSNSSDTEVHSEELQALREAREQLIDRALCCVCKDHIAHMILFPCRHMCTCCICCNILGCGHWCPVCRASIAQFQPIGITCQWRSQWGWGMAYRPLTATNTLPPAIKFFSHAKVLPNSSENRIHSLYIIM